MSKVSFLHMEALISQLHGQEPYKDDRLDGDYELISCFDLRGIIRYVCPHHKDLLDFTSSELTGLHGFEVIHPQERGRLHGYWQQVKDSQRTSEARFRVRNKRGEWIPVHTLLSPYVVEGEVVAFIHFSNLEPTQR